MCLFCFQPEIPSLSTFSLHSNLSAYQSLLLKPEGELLVYYFFSCFIRENVRIENFCLSDLVDGCQQLGKGPSLPRVSALLPTLCTGML